MEPKNLMTARVTAPVTEANKEKYHELAESLGITEADLVRRALEEYHQAEIENEQILAEQERNYQSAIALR